MPYSCQPEQQNTDRTSSTSLAISFTQFVLSGGVCFVIGTGLLYLLTDIWHLHYLLSTLIATLIINALGFLINRRFAFREQASSFWQELFRYYVVNSGALACNLVLMAICVSGFGIPYLPASVGIAVVMTVFNFLLHRFWSFRTR